jgi:M6 family metalloprotease-like protein
MFLRIEWTGVVFAGLCVSIAALFAPTGALAIGPPTSDEVQRMKAAGVLDERVERAERFGLFRLQEGLQQKANRKIQAESRRALGLPSTVGPWGAGGRVMAFPFTKAPDLRSSGTVRTLTILVDFADHRAAQELPGMMPAVFQQNIYGNGTQAAQAFFPYESLHGYYNRASQGKVNVQGDVLGWYHFGKNRQEYEPSGPDDAAWQRALLAIITEALKSYDADHDFAQYDNDNDGDIDLVTILYTGKPAGWMSFWWAYRWAFYIPEAEQVRFDGKRLRQFVFQFIDPRAGNDFNPNTLIHEMGHAFGLPDYYDYKPSQGPDGGLGGLDMMDANQGNHNAFSRWLLDWIEPEVIGGGAPAVKTLLASGGAANSNKAIAIFPGLPHTNAPAQELFMIENRTRVGNDSKQANMPNDGLLIWHIDATPQGDDFVNDNSYTEYKLIRLMRANNANDFATNEYASSDTYYRKGAAFTPSSDPPSSTNLGLPTGISVTDISGGGPSMTVRIGLLTPAGAAPPVVAAAAPAARPVAAAALAPTVDSAWSQSAEQPANLGDLERLVEILQNATPQQLQAAWEQKKSPKRWSSRADGNALVLQVLLTQWAAKDGPAAMKALLQLPPSGFVSRTFPTVIEAWANNDPQAAAKWYFAPEQGKVRASKSLVAGERFARVVYKQLALQDPAKAIASMDSLSHVSEISGALQGVRSASAAANLSQKKLDEQFRRLARNQDAVAALRRVQEAATAADKEIQDPKKRAEFHEYMQEKGAH